MVARDLICGVVRVEICSYQMILITSFFQLNDYDLGPTSDFSKKKKKMQIRVGVTAGTLSRHAGVAKPLPPYSFCLFGTVDS